uniref:Zinc ribbon domain-containing protein n=1 Tax=candidate division WOR-3 bacterium TaxID=2052148 RepID=A0A7C6AHA0_UNCW3
MENNFEKLKAIENERNDLLNKLQKIEEKKAHVSNEVYLKVKGDYEARLKKLDEKIAENKELLMIEMKNAKKELSELLQKQKELKLRLEEIELRYSIGEYSEDQFNEFEKETKGNLAGVEERIRKLEDRIKWCEGLIGAEQVEETRVIEEVDEVPAVEEEKKGEDLTIDEHILEEKLPDEVKKLDELLVETSALLEETEKKEEPKKEKKEEGIACPKCGYLNPPDSWYCEKCGAEILTIN